MLKMRRAHQRGDTIIEVLLAITVFSLVAVGAMTIMNSGTNTTQRSLELSLVRQQVDAQAEALRAAYQEGIASHNAGGSATVWDQIKLVGDMSPLATSSTCPDNFGSGFVINDHTADRLNPSAIKSMNAPSSPPYARTTYAGDVLQESYGIWIEKETKSSANASIPRAYDFRVRACWYGPGQSVPMQLQTIVRLYEAY